MVQDVFFPLLAACWLAALAAQAVSYRRSSGERRQQLKWLLFGAVAGAIALPLALSLSASHGLTELEAGIAATAGLLLATRVLPLSSPVAVAASTLAAAALFNPLRRRVQRVVDRRFNRARYDADRIVAAFAARLTDAVDLHTVRDELTEAVCRALEPAAVSVWISAPAEDGMQRDRVHLSIGILSHSY